METRHATEAILLTRHFTVGDWFVAPERGQVCRDGITGRVEPKVMEVLVYLAQHQGEVVTREDLERHVWRGAVVGYEAVTNTVIKLRKALGDRAREPGIIATVPKRGYRLVAPVRYLEEQEEPRPPGHSTAERVSAPAAKARSRLLKVTLTATTVVLVAGLAMALRAIWPPATLESRPPSAGERTRTPSIVVLPFESLGDDAQQGHFADGITEDLITDLSRLSQLSVIASNTAFTFKGRQVRPQEVGRELGVDFVVEGDIRRDGQSVRVNARLVDARTGFQKWARRYDRQLAQVFAVQDEVTDSIVAALSINLTSQEKEWLALRTTDNLVAYDHFQEGQRLSKMQTREASVLAQDAYRSAIEADPTYGRAYGALAYVLARSFSHGWTDTPEETIDRALELAKKSVALDASIPQTYWALGYVYLMRREYGKAEAAAHDALNVAPNYADGYGLLALIKNTLGEPESAIQLIKRGMALNPYYTWDYPYNLGRAYYTLGRIDEAIGALREAEKRNENAPAVRLQLAASYARAGRLEDAQWEVQELQVLSPSDTISQLKRAAPINDPKLMSDFVADLRKARLPE